MSGTELKPTIFFTVGTDHHPFERLVAAADAWSRAHPEVDVLVQHGATRPPEVARGVDYLGRDEQADAMASAAVVVCHGGPATIADARSTGRLPLVLPRDGDLGEHVDRHQVAYARSCGEEGLARVTEEVDELLANLDAALADPDWLLAGADDGSYDLAIDRTTTLLRRLAGDRVPVLYVAGLGRSGSTLLDRLLGQVGGVCSVGELVFLSERGLVRNERCGCGARFLDCPFWHEVGEVGFGGWANVDAGRAITLRHAVDRNRYLPLLVGTAVAPPSWRAARRALLDDHLDPLYRAIRQVSGAQVIVDSSKHTSYAYLLRKLWSVDLKVAHVVRRGEGVAHSWRKEVARPETDGADQMARYSPLRSSALWTTHNALLQGLPKLDVPTEVVRYEDLVEDTEATLKRVLGLVKIGRRSGELSFLRTDETGTHSTLGTDHTVAGNPMRFATGEIAIRGDEAWRNELPHRDQRLVRAITAPLRGRFAYSSD